MDLDLSPAPGRYPFRLSERLLVVVLDIAGELAVLGFFLDGELVHLVDEPAGEA